MPPRLLLDTHILVRWLFESRKLSRMQLRLLEAAARRGEALALSAVTLFEIAMLVDADRLVLKVTLGKLFHGLHANPVVRVLPVTFEVAVEARLCEFCAIPRTV